MSEPSKFEGWAVVVEEWRPVVGYEGLYEVSNLGRVQRGDRLRKLSPNDYGYIVVQLWRDGQYRQFLVHVLVAAAFLGPCPDGYEVNHKHGDKADNRASELEYMTRSDNNKHAYTTGLRVVTEKQRTSSRRRPRVTVPCQCGCGASIETPDRKGRDRQFVTGHNMRALA
jgi:hypothetical protein